MLHWIQFAEFHTGTSTAIPRFSNADAPDGVWPCSYVLTTDTGNLPTARHMQDTFDRILKVCNMQHYGTHSLRHTFATKLLEKTKNLRDIKTVAAIMGDGYRVIIKTYLHPDEDNKYDLVASL